MRICNGVVDTISAVKSRLDNDRMAYVRFGDGELGIMADWRDDAFHHKSPKLAAELKDAFAIDHPDFMIGLPLFPLEPGMDGNRFVVSHHEKMDRIIMGAAKHREFYSQVAFHYASLFMPETLIDLLKSLQAKESLVIGGDHLRAILPFTKSRALVETPKADAYDKIDEIEQTTLALIEKYKTRVIFLACGVAAATLQKRLWSVPNLVTLDIGSTFDAMLGMETRGWINESRPMIQKLRIMSEELCR